MARKVVYQLIDDLDGTQLADGVGETVKFGLDGVDYEIDLGPDNAEALREFLSSYVKTGRRVSGRVARTKLPKAGPKRDLAVVRKWAAANGYEVADRGRVPQQVLDAFDAAN
ncbi:histone-like nucleoid-structuring protein Lsr2 [Gulosibacter bifidus]|uniref:Lsr2 family protein n=1 Tax=Gulosibacter bifidus TaxID=272239 RepID=A0ABW5RKA3_9MICO|nr:Lsr2 family protein [Gulosibacter bifidus]